MKTITPPRVHPSLTGGVSVPLFAILLILTVFLPGLSQSAEIPRAALQHKHILIREARFVCGMNAPVATFAGQIHQESQWRSDAVSPVGAQGLGQFMPQTSTWLPQVDPQSGSPMPFSPGWAIRALIVYDDWLLARVKGRTLCDRWFKTLCAYNGGLAWVYRDERLATQMGRDASTWSGIEGVNAGRSATNFRENRQYPLRIIERWQGLYVTAGWGTGVCHVD